MKAFTYTEYGPPEEVLKLTDVEKPSPKDDEVLVRIKATAINDYDYSMTTGKPGIYKLMFGLSRPKKPIPGMELSGVVEDVGTYVNNLSIGDEVYGDISTVGIGSFAEYICVKATEMSIKPSILSHEEAASVPHAALLALQGLRDLGQIRTGQKVLINGAGGGVGAFSLQIAKLYNCEVTGVDSGDKLKQLKDFGFDHVIDYQKEDFTKSDILYDLILDCKTNKSPTSYFKALNKEGRYVSVGGEVVPLLRLFFGGGIRSKFSSKKLKILALKPNKGLDYINELFLENKLKCVLDGPYSFNEIPRLIQYFGDAKHYGKIVVRVGE